MSIASRLILQDDWDKVLRENEEKVWISYKNQNPKSVHGELQNHGLSSDNVPYVIGSEGFNVQQVTKSSITVTYRGDTEELTRKFVSSQTSFKNIHESRKSVVSLDASNGGLAVSADSAGKLKIWLSSTGEVRRELEGHYGDVYTCRLFPSGIVVLSGGADMQLKIWSAETGKCAANIIGHTAAILDTAVVDRGRNVVSCSKDGTAKLWDVGQQQCLSTFTEIGGNVNCCSLGSIEGAISLEEPRGPVNEREVMTSGKLLLVGCENSTLQGYGLQNRQKIFELGCHDAVNCSCFLSENTAVCGTQSGHITVVDLRNYRVPLKEWKESRSAILSLAPHKTGFFTSTGDGSCFYVDGQYNTMIELTGPDCDPVYKVVCNDTHIYTSCRDGTVRKYNLSDTGI